MTEDCLDTRKVQFPRKDDKHAGITTPKRVSTNSHGTNSAASRPTSPKVDGDNDFVNGNTVMAAALQKKVSRKRKVSIFSEMKTK